MLTKCIVFYVIILINLGTKTSEAVTNKTNVLQGKFTNFSWSSLSNEDDNWQPIIKTHQRMSVGGKSLEQNVNFRNHSKVNVKPKSQRGYLKPQTYYNFQQNGNYTKRNVKPLTFSSTNTSEQTSPTYSTLNYIKNTKFKSYVAPTNYKYNKTRIRGRGRQKLNASSQHHQEHHHNHRQQFNQVYPLNNIETLYPSIQIPKDIISQVQEQPLSSAKHHHSKYEKNSIPSISSTSQLNLQHHNITDVKEYKILPTSFSSPPSLYWHYLPEPPVEANNIISLTPKIDTSNTNTTKLINLKIKTNTIENDNEFDRRKQENVKNFNIYADVTKTLNSLSVNKNLIDNQITNTKKHPYYKTLENTDVKPEKDTHNLPNEKSLKSPLKDGPANNSLNVDDVTKDNLNLEWFLLKQTLNNAKKVYDNIKDLILSDTDNSSASSSSKNDDNDDYDDDDVIYSNKKDKIHDDDNDLQTRNISPHQAFKDDTSSTTTNSMEEILSSVIEDIDSLNIKNILLSTTTTPAKEIAASASIGEVQGRQKQNYKGTIKYSLITTPSSQLTTSPPVTISVADTNNTQYMITTSTTEKNDTILQEGRPRVWKLPIKKHKLTNTSLTLPTPKGLRIVNSGRKLKKVKKKLKKILMPLLLAYKLKFMALIPLLISGLILLVSSTGMAGFFFALFTAVMSLKSSGPNSVIVKKYEH